jgi:putative redox protein
MTTADADRAKSSEGTVTVTEADSGTYTQEISIGHHRLIADEPLPLGDDAGPSHMISCCPGWEHARR